MFIKFKTINDIKLCITHPENAISFVLMTVNKWALTLGCKHYKFLQHIGKNLYIRVRVQCVCVYSVWRWNAINNMQVFEPGCMPLGINYSLPTK